MPVAACGHPIAPLHGGSIDLDYLCQPMRLHALTLAILLTAPLSAQSRHWPMFRGPNATGTTTGTPPTAWHAPDGDGVLWVISASPADRAVTVIHLESASQRLITRRAKR
jgi:hypothetical protein